MTVLAGIMRDMLVAAPCARGDMLAKRFCSAGFN